MILQLLYSHFVHVVIYINYLISKKKTNGKKGKQSIKLESFYLHLLYIR